MSVSVPSGREAQSKTATVVTALRTETRVKIGLTVWSLLLAVLMWRTWGDVRLDTGYDLVAAARTAHGELPYVDYVYWYGPLSPMLLGGIYSITGTSIWPAAALGLVLAGAAVALTYRLARLLVPALPAGLAAALVAPAAFSSANNSYVLPHSTSAPLSIVLVLGALLLLLKPATLRSRSGAGVLCGLVAITRPEIALAFGAAVTAWLAVSIWRPAGERSDAVRQALAVLVPAVLIPLFVYGAFAAAVGVDDLLTVNLYPQAFVDAAGHVVLESHAPKTLASFVKLFALTELYVAGIVGLLVVAFALRRGGRARTAAIVVAAGAALCFAAVLAARPETVRYYLLYAYAWIPAGAWVAVVALVWRGRRRDHRWTRVELAALAVSLTLACVTLSTYASFKPFPNAAFPEATPYLLPIVGVFLAWLHGGVLRRTGAIGLGWLALLVLASGALALHDASKETGVIRGPGGSLTTLAGDAPALQSALNLIERETKPGEPILLAPQLSSLYVLSGHPNPLPQISLLPGALATPADETAAIRKMDGVRLVVVNRTPLSAYRQGAFGMTFDRQLYAWLQRDFRRVALPGSSGQDALKIEAWLRRSP